MQDPSGSPGEERCRHEAWEGVYEADARVVPGETLKGQCKHSSRVDRWLTIVVARVAKVQILLVHLALLPAGQYRHHARARGRVEQRQQALDDIQPAVVTRRHRRLETLSCLLAAGERDEADRLKEKIKLGFSCLDKINDIASLADE